jgi:hypothetical protein
VERAREWAAELRRRADEVLATLAAEGVMIESAFLMRAQDGDYLIYFMKAANFEEAARVARESTCDIDEYHRVFKRDAWESAEELELLIHFDRTDS